ncbi:alpha-2-glucosyltransferase Alg10 [Cokeromyces recurvatus]|uniref:alpha-2-glucosyltransferase Alg10 n=1 Tax=Cokeromyces recurvatus TaxID=90255 RepID=UPI002220FD7B|nr:alpha-2-glucosyltransferase Alg10 [Cokeromyces recurvatus]KAI7902365.1 alpha-2-glucosyltransferase Alg10 [Cokeromyces recurvatus]
MIFVLHVINLLMTAAVVNTKVSNPYMDEIFHISQAQQYCRGDFYSWDPKLTTPPGLYLLSNVFVYVGKLFNYDLCTVNALRFTNILFSIGLYFILVSLTKTSRVYALSLAWFPVGFFYNFLYYTDAGSTFFVLLSYLLVKRRWYRLSGVMGIVSMTFRQTNVIWVCLFMMVTIIDTLSLNESSKKNDDHSNCLYNPLCATIMNSPVQMLRSILSLTVNILENFKTLLPNIVTFLIAIFSFALFLIWNNGIVLGDRSNHIAGLHFPQLFYFTSFLSFFSAPWTLSLTAISDLIFHSSIKKILYGLLSCVVSLYLVFKYTYEHPFILSDNRHYSFYVWKKVYRRHWTIRYLLTPVYVLSEILNFQAFANHTSFLLALGYLTALVLTLVPSPLLEFRYFIIPFLFYMVHIPPPKQTWRLLSGLAFYIFIHLITLYLFLFKPFVWLNEPNQLQRFMW